MTRMDTRSRVLIGLLLFLAMFWLFIGFFWFLSRKAKGQMGGMGQIGKSTAKLHKPHEPTTRFADVAGYNEVKEEVREVVAFLREPDKFRRAGAEVPKGMLLVWALRGPARRCWRGPPPVRPA